MNAFCKFNPPETNDNADWREAVEVYCHSLEGAEERGLAVKEVVSFVRDAISSQRVCFKRGDVPEALGFLNGVLSALRKVEPTVTAWDLNDLVPPCSRVFVVPDEREFKYERVFTL